MISESFETVEECVMISEAERNTDLSSLKHANKKSIELQDEVSIRIVQMLLFLISKTEAISVPYLVVLLR